MVHDLVSVSVECACRAAVDDGAPPQTLHADGNVRVHARVLLALYTLHGRHDSPVVLPLQRVCELRQGCLGVPCSKRKEEKWWGIGRKKDTIRNNGRITVRKKERKNAREEYIRNKHNKNQERRNNDRKYKRNKERDKEKERTTHK